MGKSAISMAISNSYVVMHEFAKQILSLKVSVLALDRWAEHSSVEDPCAPPLHAVDPSPQLALGKLGTTDEDDVARLCQSESLRMGSFLASNWPGLFFKMYPLVIERSYRKSPFLIGKPSINEPFSMAMLNSQMVLEKCIGKMLKGF